MGIIIAGQKIQGVRLRSNLTINALDAVVAHWDYKTNVTEHTILGNQHARSWLDQKNGYGLAKQGVGGSGFQIFSDGIGQNAGAPITMVGGNVLDLLCDQSAMSLHMVVRKKTIVGDSAEFQFGKILGGITIHALYGGTRNGNVRARYPGSLNLAALPDDQFVLLSWLHYGGGAINNLKMFGVAAGVSVNGLSSTGGPNSGSSLTLRLANGSGIDFRCKKIVIASHTGLTPTQIDSWRLNTFIPTLKAEAAEYGSLIT